MISLGNVEVVILDQLESYYPQRVDDYKSGRLEVRLYVLHTSDDVDYYNQLRQRTSITDPTCTLIMGFEKAILFLIIPMIDVEV